MVRPEKKQILRAPNRGVDGFPITIHKKSVPGTSGASALELSLDLESAPVPQRRYHADVAQVLPDDAGGVRLLFGQRQVVGPGLRSLMVVTMTPEAVRGFLSSCRTFLPNLKDFLDRNKIEVPNLFEVKDEPDQTVSFVVNLIALVFASREAVLDMYQMSAWSLLDLKERATVSVDPVVRIDISAALVCALITDLHTRSPLLPEDVR